MPALPIEWIAWANRLQAASLYFNEDFRKAANDLSNEMFLDLADFYTVAERDNQLHVINEWLQANISNVAERRAEKGIRNLVVLFSHVARVWGRRPFTTQALNSTMLYPPLPDWSKLPDDLKFMAEPAEKCMRFQYVFSDEGRERVSSEIILQERDALLSVAKNVRRVGYKTIQDWRRPLDMQAHIESAMIFNLMGVLDALGLPYYDGAHD